ncbi:carbohydrate kinase family protein, partial [Capnocytophaga cynodegmi]
MKNIVVGLGEILWDVFPERKILGGAPANFAYHASQFGFEGYVVSAVGSDVLGHEILRSLKRKELNALVETVDFPTGTVQVTLSGAGIPQYEICENVAWDNIPFTTETENLAKKTQVVCFGSLAQRSEVSRQTIHKFIQTMPPDSLKIFDINLRLNYYTKEIIDESLKLSNMMKLNDEEVVKIANLFGWQGTEEEICKRLLQEYGLRIVILTKGTQGSYVFATDKISFVSSPKVHVADTVGAGDSFTAAFVAAYLNGQSVEEAQQLAAEV